MGQARPRKWDRGEVTLMGQGGHVNGTGLRGFGLEDWVGPRAPGMGRDWRGTVYKRFPGAPWGFKKHGMIGKEKVYSIVPYILS